MYIYSARDQLSTKSSDFTTILTVRLDVCVMAPSVHCGFVLPASSWRRLVLKYNVPGLFPIIPGYTQRRDIREREGQGKQKQEGKKEGKKET